MRQDRRRGDLVRGGAMDALGGHGEEQEQLGGLRAFFRRRIGGLFRGAIDAGELQPGIPHPGATGLAGTWSRELQPGATHPQAIPSPPRPRCRFRLRAAGDSSSRRFAPRRGWSLLAASLGALLLAALFAVPAAGQQEAETADLAKRPSLQAVRLEAPPLLDGEVREDFAWQDVPAATEFWQNRPDLGAPATERTEVRVGFTGDTLWVSVIAFDSEPDKIIVADARRDASLSNTDSFQLIFDPFLDQRNGLVFGTTPAGIEYDAQVANEGAGGFGGGRQQGGSGGGFNINWDGVWQVATQVGDWGWSAEMAIPFRTLRYPSAADQPVQSWGVNFQRNIGRKREVAFWAPLQQNFEIYRLTYAGRLEGVEPPPQRNLKLTPYALVSGRQLPTGPDDIEDDFEAGIDLKYSVTPSLTLDATYNTDFAQVEVDEQQINLDRFNLFFPEKRPFFLENAGLFSVGSPGEVELFFSRRIGLGASGEPIPILGGARLSGKVGDTGIGVLDMQTEEFEGMAGDNFAVARVLHELPNRSNIGGLFVQRVGVGSLAPDDDENRTYALDGQIGIGEYHTVRGFVAQTETPGVDGDEHAYQLDWTLRAPNWTTFVNYLEVGEQFNPEVGFLARKGFRKPSALIYRVIRPKDLWGLHELRPHVSYRGFWDFDGFQETGYLHVDNHWEWRNGYEVHTGVNFTYEGVKEPFEINPGVFVSPGEYDNAEAQIVFYTDRADPLSFSLFSVVGGFFGGDRVSLTPTVNWRWGERLTSQLNWNYNDIDLPEGAFEVNLGRLRLTYTFTPRVLLQALVQYNDRTEQVSTNLRFSWLRDANTGLFVVYNEIDEWGSRGGFERPDRSLIVKYSHLFDVFGRR